MLWKLLVESVRPYWNLLWGVIIFQFAQSIANLILPTLNADIIDKGVATGDINYIWRTGGAMLVLSFVQVICAIIGGLLRRQARDASWPGPPGAPGVSSRSPSAESTSSGSARPPSSRAQRTTFNRSRCWCSCQQRS